MSNEIDIAHLRKLLAELSSVNSNGDIASRIIREIMNALPGLLDEVERLHGQIQRIEQVQVEERCVFPGAYCDAWKGEQKDLVEIVCHHFSQAGERIAQLEAEVAQDERLYEELRAHTQKLEAALREIIKGVPSGIGVNGPLIVANIARAALERKDPK